MNKMFDYLQAQADEAASSSSDPPRPDTTDFDQAVAEVHALMQDAPIPSPSER